MKNCLYKSAVPPCAGAGFGLWGLGIQDIAQHIGPPVWAPGPDWTRPALGPVWSGPD